MLARKPIKMTDATAVAKLWIQAGGSRDIEVGALEPLLWNEGHLRVPDLIRALSSVGANVSMTTNASKLSQFVPALKGSGLSKLRVSWHTTNPATFAAISGHGDYEEFFEGLEIAAQAGLNISFNRVLLKGYAHDIPQQLDFVEKYNLRLKLYDLLWTPEITQTYEDLYQAWRPLVREFVLPRTGRVQRIRKKQGRMRLRFYLKRGGHVEVKLGDRVNRAKAPCATCPHKMNCLEEFGDYFRVEPELDCYFCYLRRDLTFSLCDIIDDPDGPAALRKRLLALCGPAGISILAGSTLRFIAVPFCNFNCFIPGTSISWCHKNSGNYAFPGRPIASLQVVGQ